MYIVPSEFGGPDSGYKPLFSSPVSFLVFHHDMPLLHIGLNQTPPLQSVLSKPAVKLHRSRLLFKPVVMELIVVGLYYQPFVISALMNSAG